MLWVKLRGSHDPHYVQNISSWDFSLSSCWFLMIYHSAAAISQFKVNILKHCSWKQHWQNTWNEWACRFLSRHPLAQEKRLTDQSGVSASNHRSKLQVTQIIIPLNNWDLKCHGQITLWMSKETLKRKPFSVLHIGINLSCQLIVAI